MGHPDKTAALEAAGLWPVTEYIRRCQETVARWVATRPLDVVCRAAPLLSGRNKQRLRWWHHNCEANDLGRYLLVVSNRLF